MGVVHYCLVLLLFASLTQVRCKKKKYDWQDVNDLDSGVVEGSGGGGSSSRARRPYRPPQVQAAPPSNSLPAETDDVDLLEGSGRSSPEAAHPTVNPWIATTASSPHRHHEDEDTAVEGSGDEEQMAGVWQPPATMPPTTKTTTSAPTTTTTTWKPPSSSPTPPEDDDDFAIQESSGDGSTDDLNRNIQTEVRPVTEAIIPPVWRQPEPVSTTPYYWIPPPASTTPPRLDFEISEQKTTAEPVTVPITRWQPAAEMTTESPTSPADIYEPEVDAISRLKMFFKPGLFAAVVGGGVVGLLAAIMLFMFIVYRMRKKDEGSYALEEPKAPPTYPYAYHKAPAKEFYA